MKVWGHLVAFILALSVFDTILAALILRIFDPTPTTAATVAVSAFLFAVVVTNGPGGILLRRLYDHHQEHADDIARWLKGLVLSFEADRATDTLRVADPALNPANHASRPAMKSSEVLLWLGAHMKKGRDYKRNYFRSEFALLVQANHEFERLYREARTAVNRAVESEVNRFWPEMPKSYAAGESYLELAGIQSAAWDVVWMREYRGVTVAATVHAQNTTNPPFRLSWKGGPGEREHYLAELKAEDSVTANLQSLLTAHTGREDLVKQIKDVAAARRLLETKYETTSKEREKIAWRIARNRDVGGKCDDCPKFLG